MARKREDKTKAGTHHGLTPTDRTVELINQDGTNAYTAHIYVCPCGAKGTRRALKKKICPLAPARWAANKVNERQLRTDKHARKSGRLPRMTEPAN